MYNLYFAYTDYSATGEGRTLFFLAGIGDEKTARERFSHYVDPYFQRGFTFRRTVPKHYKQYLPALMCDLLSKKVEPYPFEYFVTFHFNLT